MSAAGEAVRGFTLLEMLVVLAVTALIGGIAFPAIERMTARRELATAMRGYDLALVSARASAVARGSAVAFAPPSALPDDGIAVALPAAAIRFFGDGTSTGGTITFDGGSRHGEITVDPQSGTVSVRP